MIDICSSVHLRTCSFVHLCIAVTLFHFHYMYMNIAVVLLGSLQLVFANHRFHALMISVMYGLKQIIHEAATFVAHDRLYV